jgi:hypothetical protein
MMAEIFKMAVFLKLLFFPNQNRLENDFGAVLQLSFEEKY